jgi:hypothetical protein
MRWPWARRGDFAPGIAHKVKRNGVAIDNRRPSVAVLRRMIVDDQ